jgi:uncharacterized protein (TIGR02246 family)
MSPNNTTQTPSTLLIDALVKAYNDHDAKAFAGFFAENAVAYEHPGRPAQTGRAEIETFYRQRFQELPELRTHVIHRIVFGDYVIDHERVQRANDLAPFETLAINLVKDGAIQRLDIVR